MKNMVTLTGFWSATGGSVRTITVDLANGTAVEIKSRRMGKRYASKITNASRLAKLIEAAKRQAAKS